MKFQLIILTNILFYLINCQKNDSNIIMALVNMNVSEAIQFYGYPVEDHEAVTDDGYILSLQRIPHGRNNKAFRNEVVLLQHGVLHTSFTWIVNGPKRSLGFILADHGYDVWIGNSRGNKYSRKHKSLSPESKEFWDFTWDEMAKYDFPSTIDYILKITNATKLKYIGHSQGAAIAFARLSNNDSINKKVASFAALAPAVYIGNVQSDSKDVMLLAYKMNELAQLLNHGEMFENRETMNKMYNFICTSWPSVKQCVNGVYTGGQLDMSNFDISKVPLYLAHTPAGTSSKNILHYAQSTQVNKFQLFDYGTDGNLLKYNVSTPPLYKLNSYGVPVGIFYGGRDLETIPGNVNRTIKELGTSVVYTKYIPKYGHLDMIWAKDSNKLVYRHLVNFLQRYK